MLRLAVGWIAVMAAVAVPATADDRPERIVSVGGSVTKTLYALGFGDRIVGVDTTSLYPREALASKPNVGYMRQLSPEGVLSLHPQIVLSIAGAGPKEALETLSHAGVPLATVPETYSEDGLSFDTNKKACANDDQIRDKFRSDPPPEDILNLSSGNRLQWA